MRVQDTWRFGVSGRLWATRIAQHGWCLTRRHVLYTTLPVICGCILLLTACGSHSAAQPPPGGQESAQGSANGTSFGASGTAVNGTPKLTTHSPTPQTPTPPTGQTGDTAATALSAYLTGLYDTNAKYFYADTTRTSYNDFWKEAISWNVIMDAYVRTTSSSSRQLIDDVYDGFMARHADMATACNTATSFTLSNTYNDDVGWWANASIRAYELTGESRYVHCAQRLFDTIYASWDTSTYGGGIWWTRSQPTQKNVATNAPAAITAAKLAAALGDSSYLTKAKQIYAWVIQALTNGMGTVYDDYNSSTKNTGQLTYNYGTVIGAADALYHATTDASYLAGATTVATTSLTKVTRDGILQDEGSGDGGEFKGIYAQYLAELTYKYHQSQYNGFLQKNAAVAWANRRSPDNLVGSNWEVAAPSGTLTTSAATSAVAILQVTAAQ